MSKKINDIKNLIEIEKVSKNVTDSLVESLIQYVTGTDDSIFDDIDIDEVDVGLSLLPSRTRILELYNEGIDTSLGMDNKSKEIVYEFKELDSNFRVKGSYSTRNTILEKECDKGVNIYPSIEEH